MDCFKEALDLIKHERGTQLIEAFLDRQDINPNINTINLPKNVDMLYSAIMGKDLIRFMFSAQIELEKNIDLEPIDIQFKMHIALCNAVKIVKDRFS